MIRIATEQDAAEIRRLGKRFAFASGYGEEVGFDDADAVTFTDSLSNPDMVAVVADGDTPGTLAGVVVGILAPMYFNSAVIMAQELFWWVESDYRKRGVGQGLLAVFEDEARKRGAHLASVSSIDDFSGPAVAAMYQARGYKAAERCYFRRL